MRRVLVGLPLDGRPVVRAQVQQLVALAHGFSLECPEISQLGHFRRPADRLWLDRWLLSKRQQAAAWVLSLDMLVYGGLIPSRFIDDDEAQLQERLALLRQLKRPGVPLCAFAATMRISNNNIADEEKPYWKSYGTQLWCWSYFSDRFQQLGQEADAQLAAEAAEQIPSEIRADYQATRQRNMAINLAALDAVEDGVIDRLILPQDDTAEFGFNIAERRCLQAEVARRGLTDKVLIYAGADEVMHTLCAWVVGRLRRDEPLRLNVVPTDPLNWRELIPLYEDRPLSHALTAQMEAVGAVIDETSPHVLLLLHTQGSAQGDWAMGKPLPSRTHVSESVWQALADARTKGLFVALADDAYANGGDPEFIQQFAGRFRLRDLAGYAGWNTSSNRIGSLLAQLSLARGSWTSSDNQAVLALRLSEDLLWQSQLRRQLRATSPEAQTPVSVLAERAQALMLHDGNAWLQAQGFGHRICQAWLPWDRSFEVGLRLEART